MTKHSEHTTVEAWHMDCLEGGCEHRDERGEPEDLSVCPSFQMEVCVDCMAERGFERVTTWWEGPFDEWPCTASIPPLADHGPDPEPPIFRPNNENKVKA